MGEDNIVVTDGPFSGFWTKMIVMLILLAIIILAGFNASEYNKAANGEELNQGGARALMWINIVGLIVLIPIFVYIAWNFFLQASAKSYAKEKAMIAYEWSKQQAKSGYSNVKQWGNQYDSGIIGYNTSPGPMMSNNVMGMGGPTNVVLPSNSGMTSSRSMGGGSGMIGSPSMNSSQNPFRNL